jgi:hypothetical protein
MSGRELPHALGNDVDEQLLAGNHFESFFKKSAGHRENRVPGKTDARFEGDPGFVNRKFRPPDCFDSLPHLHQSRRL